MGFLAIAGAIGSFVENIGNALGDLALGVIQKLIIPFLIFAVIMTLFTLVLALIPVPATWMDPVTSTGAAVVAPGALQQSVLTYFWGNVWSFIGSIFHLV